MQHPWEFYYRFFVKKASCHAGFYIVLWILALWISMNFYGFCRLCLVVWKEYYWLSHRVSLFHIFQNGSIYWNSGRILLLTVSNRYSFGIVRSFICQEVQKTSGPEIIVQSVVNVPPSYSYLRWYHSHAYLFHVIEILRTKFFTRCVVCNTLSPGYVPRYVSQLFDHIFLFSPCIFFT